MKRAPRSHQRHDLCRKYHGQDSEIRDLLGEYGVTIVLNETGMTDEVALEASGKLITA